MKQWNCRKEPIIVFSHCFHLSVYSSSCEAVTSETCCPFWFLFICLGWIKHFNPLPSQLGLDLLQVARLLIHSQVGIPTWTKSWDSQESLWCVLGLAQPNPFSQDSHENGWVERPKGWAVWGQVWLSPTPWQNENWDKRALVIMSAACTTFLFLFYFHQLWNKAKSLHDWWFVRKLNPLLRQGPMMLWCDSRIPPTSSNLPLFSRLLPIIPLLSIFRALMCC